ncbi:MAG TPA: TonB-dependent receptor [Steroidobacter sp.]|uniref:TonB-dependent receptor n=1 Tax=Steroidobacter sp. TaxID=1978227 RepID=UPI002ED92D81
MSTNRRNVRASFRLSRAGTLAASVLAILTAAADAQAVTEWDLPEQPLAKSLRAIASQSESNIIFDRKLVNNRLAPPLKTQASAEDALLQVLEGTGLTYRHLDEKTVTIQLASTDPSAATSALYGLKDGRIRLAQAETDETRRGRTVEGRTLIDIEEIIVTGTNIRGIENSTAPVIVLSREYIDSTGFGSVTKLVESLPQNFALANQSSLPDGSGAVSNSREQGSSINLRGIGEGTTLVLLNGRRLAPGFRSAAADISSLPLTAIDRIEILTDGASAIYGSDAVGGVVNFILREDFEGAETRVRAGFADGTNEYRVSQALGNSWSSGNALLSVEYYKRDELLTRDRDFIPANVAAVGLLPEDENISAVFTGEQQLSGTVTAFADVLYAQRDSFNRAARVTPTFGGDAPSAEVDNPQLNATLGLNWALGGDWQLELSGSYGSNDLETKAGGINFQGSAFDSKFETTSGRIKADGTVLGLPGGNLRMAIGADYRSETYEDTNTLAGGIVLSSTDTDQDVSSAFAELYIPLVGEPNAMAGVRALELSLAGRYDDYSSFGSSFDPQYGLMWEPVEGLRLRARHGTSYKAPNLVEYSFGGNVAAAVLSVDPMSPTGFSYQLQVLGTDVDSLRAQESTSTSFGLEFTPEAIKGLAMTVNYYRIKYRNRITTPPVAPVALADPASFGSLFIRNPSIDQVNQFIAIGQLGPLGFIPLSPIDFMFDPNFDPATVEVITDGRRRNLSLVETNGLDFSTRYDFGVGSSNVAIGIDATYVLQIEQQITSTSAPFDTDDTFGNPPNLRMRAMASWQRGSWSANAFVNYTDSYTDNRLTVPVSIDAFTTVDARVAYSFSNQFSSGFLSGVTVGLSVLNLLDEDPPSTVVQSPPIAPSFDLGFDPTNASPLGRFFALEFTKTW